MRDIRMYRRDRGALVHLIAFVAVTTVLLTVARSGAETLVVTTALLMFVAVATLWLRRQYVDARDRRQWVLPGNAAVVTLGVGAVLLVTYVLTSAEAAAAAGVALFWIGGSALITRMRDKHPRGENGFLDGLFRTIHPHRLGLGLAVAALGVAMTFAACLILAGHIGLTTTWAGVAALVGLGILTPVGVALLSEGALAVIARRAEATPPPEGRLDRLIPHWGVLIGVGVVLFGAVAWLGSVWGGSMLLLVVFALLLAIVIGLVSSTHADIVILIALAAILGVTPQQDHRFGVTAVRGDATHQLKTLVAIGDSYLSGEGASIYYAGTDDAKKNECRRAPTSWAAMAAQSDFDAMSFLACSGARTGEIMLPGSDPQVPQDPGSKAFTKALDARGLIHPQDRSADDQGRQESQLEKWRRDQKERSLQPALVVVSVGGNDAGFSTIGVMCLAPGSCDEKRNLWMPTLSQVRDQLRLLYAEIDAVFPATPVVTVGYPDPIALPGQGAPAGQECGEVALTENEERFIHTFLTGTDDGKTNGLNDVIQQTSAEFGFHYVDTMEGALAGQNLQLCDPGNDGRPGLNFIGLRSMRGAAEQRFNPANWLHGSLHPNERGHAAMLRAFETWKARETAKAGGSLATRLPVDAAAAQRLTAARASWSADPAKTAVAPAELPPCDLFAADLTGCRTLGTQWAMEQIGDQLAKGWLAAILLAGLGAWAAAVGFFGWRRVALKRV